MASYLVLGRGVGAAIAYHLGRQKDTNSITIIDKDPSILDLASLLETGSSTHYDYLVSDITKCNINSLFGMGYDVVISALPAKYNLELAKVAINANVCFCDLGGVVSIAREITDLKHLHSQYNKTLVTGMGLMPGIGEMASQKLIWEFDRPLLASILVGGLPQKPKPPLKYNFPFSTVGLEHLCKDEAPVIENGQIVWKKPFSDYKIVVIPELARFDRGSNGEVEAFITAGTSLSPWTFQKQGIINYCEKTIRWKDFVKFFKDFNRENFQEAIKSYLTRPNHNDPDLVYMKVSVSGYVSDQYKTKSIILLDIFDQPTGLTAMERTTGFTTAKIAWMMANGMTMRGIHTPETALNRGQMNFFWQELGQHFNITYS